MFDGRFDEQIEAWHAGASPDKTLHEHLGMTWEEYRGWVEHGLVPERMREEFAFIEKSVFDQDQREA